jgi:uncharacterized membrane protein (UPF0127 family)
MFVKINDEINLKVKTCISRDEISKGMMGKRFRNFDGMLFFMGPDSHCFYMKNCIIPLDIIFIDSDLTILKIFNDCQPCMDENCEHYCADGKYILEVPGGFCEKNNIMEGDSCSIQF